MTNAPGTTLYQDEHIKVIRASDQPCSHAGCREPQVGLITFSLMESGALHQLPFCDHHLRIELEKYLGEMKVYHALSETGLSETEIDQTMRRRVLSRALDVKSN